MGRKALAAMRLCALLLMLAAALQLAGKLARSNAPAPNGLEPDRDEVVEVTPTAEHKRESDETNAPSQLGLQGSSRPSTPPRGQPPAEGPPPRLRHISEWEGTALTIWTVNADPEIDKRDLKHYRVWMNLPKVELLLFSSSPTCEAEVVSKVRCMDATCLARSGPDFACLHRRVLEEGTSDLFFFLLPGKKSLEYQALLEALHHLRGGLGGIHYLDELTTLVGYTRRDAEKARLSSPCDVHEWRRAVLRDRSTQMNIFQGASAERLLSLQAAAPAPPLPSQSSPTEGLTDYLARLGAAQLLLTYVTKKNFDLGLNWLCALQVTPGVRALVLTADAALHTRMQQDGLPAFLLPPLADLEGKGAALRLKVNVLLQIAQVSGLTAMLADPEVVFLRNLPLPQLRNQLGAMAKNKENSLFLVSSEDHQSLRTALQDLEGKGFDKHWEALPESRFPNCHPDPCLDFGNPELEFWASVQACGEQNATLKADYLKSHGRWLFFPELRQCKAIITPNRPPFALQLAAEGGGRPARPALVIKILAYNRPKSIRRLLDSLSEVDFAGDSVRLEIFVDGIDHLKEKDDSENAHAVRQVLDMAQEYHWPHGRKVVISRDRNFGLALQWLTCWESPSMDEVAMIIEDDCTVSRTAYLHLLALMDEYFLPGDYLSLRAFGIQLKSHGRFINSVRMMDDILPEGKNQTNYFFSQKLLTWAPLMFPAPWTEFMAWVRNKRLHFSYTPKIKGFNSNSWFKTNDKDKFANVWSIWFIRFVVERGLYGLSTRLKLIGAFQDPGVHALSKHSHSRYILHEQPPGQLHPIAALPIFDTKGLPVDPDPTYLEGVQSVCPKL